MVFEENLRALGKEDAFLLKDVTEFFCEKIARIDTEQVMWDEDLSGQDVPSVIAEDGTYVRLCSRYSVCHELEMWFRQYDETLKEDSLVYLMGFGTGDAVRMVLDRLSDDGAVIIYEPNTELFFQLMERHDFTDILARPNVYLFWDEINEDGIFSFLSGYCYKHWISSPDDIITMYLPSYQKAYPVAKSRFDGYLSDWVAFKDANTATTRFFMKEDVTAPLEKLYFYKDAVLMEKVKKDWDPDTPVVVIGAGPSLKKNMKYLHRAKGHMLLVAVDRTLATLSEEGIIPDIIVDVDSFVAYSKGQDAYRDVPYMGTVTTGRESFDWNTGVKIMCPDAGWASRLLEKAGLPIEPFKAFGSVAIVAFGVFVMLGTKNIILIGQDLAYSEEGDSHATGLEEGSEKQGLFMLPGYYGDPVVSRHDWFTFCDWYGQNIPKLENTQVINATEGGARIPGTVQMPFLEVLDRFGGFELDKSFLYDEKYRVSEQEYERILEGLEGLREEIRELYTWTKEDWDARKDELPDMTIGTLVQDVAYAVLQEEEGDAWSSFQRTLDLFRDNGWEAGDAAMELVALKERIIKIATMFYRGKSEEGMDLFMSVVAKIALVPGVSAYINPLFDAVEAQDYVLAADILYHEIAKGMKPQEVMS